MLSSAPRGLALHSLLAAALLVACSSGEATPEPTATKTRAPTLTPLAATAPESLSHTPTLTPTLSASLATPRAVTTDLVKAVPKDPHLPVFGPFPPVPIPDRPPNVNPLTGLNVDPAALRRRPIQVRIGNDEKPRTSAWQAGLNAADLVFEELIDILGSAYANTRYTAVFLGNDPPLIGPIRSGRLINLQIGPMLDAALSHAGASNGIRWLYSQTPMVNLDEYFNQQAYCYIQSHGYQGRLYTTAARLREWLVRKNWEAAVPLYGFSFSDSAPGGQPAATVSLTKSPWPRSAQVEWRYDAGSGKYLRFVAGAAQIDNSYTITAKWGYGPDCTPSGPEAKTQVRAANVVVLYAKHEKTDIVEDSNNAVSVYIPLTGQGDALFLRDGVSVRGKWQRRSEQEFFQFVDAAGRVYTLKPGNTWFEIVPTGYAVDLK